MTWLGLAWLGFAWLGVGGCTRHGCCLVLGHVSRMQKSLLLKYLRAILNGVLQVLLSLCTISIFILGILHTWGGGVLLGGGGLGLPGVLGDRGSTRGEALGVGDWGY